MRHKSIEKLFTLAYTDMLTGVKNRNAYEEYLNKLRRNRNMSGNLTVMVVDLNKLKEINDMFGHHSGDEALKTTARCLITSVGDKSEIFRIGGDEFVCFSNSNILSRISEFRDKISFENIIKPYNLSVSLGYLIYSSNKDGLLDIDDFIKRCDKLMYADKKKSNCVR